MLSVQLYILRRTLVLLVAVVLPFVDSLCTGVFRSRFLFSPPTRRINWVLLP